MNGHDHDEHDHDEHGHDEGEEHHHQGPTGVWTLYVYPDDVESLWEKLKEQAPVAYPLHETPYGMREFGIRDPNGFALSFGKESVGLEGRPLPAGACPVSTVLVGQITVPLDGPSTSRPTGMRRLGGGVDIVAIS